MSHPLYLGWDLSTQQLKGIAVTSDLKKTYEAKVDFDADFSNDYGVKKGVLANVDEHEIFAPVAMWLEAIDLVLERLRDDGLDFSRVRGLSGAGMQHGTVFWADGADDMLRSLKGDQCLVEQLGPQAGGKEFGAFSHPHSPNWQDASTQRQCDQFDKCLGSREELARVTGSASHHRFSGPQIMRFRSKYPEHYKNTSRISLVSSFLASVFLGGFAPIDIADVTGMNLWDIKNNAWHSELLALAGGQDEVHGLREKLGEVPEDSGKDLGKVSGYFVQRYGFNKDCTVVPATGDNPSTILALPLQASDAIVSLGTSTTFLMSTPQYKPDPSYHLMNHPTTPGLYMFMLCYKNGSLARERIRNAINATDGSSTGDSTSWDLFNEAATSAPPMTQASKDDPMNLALYFPLPEIVPNVPAGEWHFTYTPSTKTLTRLADRSSIDAATSTDPDPTTTAAETARKDARLILESQLLSLRLRSASLVTPQDNNNNNNTNTNTNTSDTGTAPLPAQPRRIYLVGGASINPAITQLCGEVLGGASGVYRLDVGGNACALGAAYKAAWARERSRGSGGGGGAGETKTETFEAFVASRWDEEGFVRKVDRGYRKGVWEAYGEALEGFRRMEGEVVEECRGTGREEGR